MLVNMLCNTWLLLIYNLDLCACALTLCELSHSRLLVNDLCNHTMYACPVHMLLEFSF